MTACLRYSKALAVLVFCIVIETGCTNLRPTGASTNEKAIVGESVVFIGEQPAQLAFPPIRHGSIQVRNVYPREGSQVVQFSEGKDFVVDYDRGTIVRTAHSRLPDFRTNMLFGIEDFDHGKFPGFGNARFFSYVDYTSKKKIAWPNQAKTPYLINTRKKLLNGDKLKIVAFGDSITAGGDASAPNLIFWQRWADSLKEKYPRATIEAVNGATGGDATRQGIERLSQKVLSQNPDLVLIGFGMNDHNIGGFGTPLNDFTNNLATIIDRIRKETHAEVVLYSTFPPNPKWHYGSHNMEAYAAATEEVARAKKCAFADVYHNWIAISERKKPEDMLANNINHPNDFGHWVYLIVLKQLGL